jgi:hypothetical protein
MRRAMLFSTIAVAAIAAIALVAGLTGDPSDATAQTTAAPDASTGEATGVAQSTAKLTGTVNPHGSATTYTFQYGLTSSYGVQTTPASAGSGTTAGSVSATLSGLASGTSYHYRIVATNADGQATSGVDRTFTTPTRESNLNLFGHTAFVGPGRQIGVFTGCLGDRSCTGSLRMTSGGVVIGSRRFFFVKRNGGGIVHVPVNSSGRRKLAAASGGHLRTQVTVSSKSAGTDSASVTVVPYK